MQDRSLGSVELHISDLAEESDHAEYQYSSTGVKSCDDPIRLDKGGGYKGSLNYTAEFVPALALKNLSFEGHSVTKPSDGMSVISGSSASSSDVEIEAVPQGITIKVTDKGNQRVSVDSKGQGSGTNGTTSNGDGYDVVSSAPSTPVKSAPPVPPKKHAGNDARGVEMSNAELLKHCKLMLRSRYILDDAKHLISASGIVVFDVMSGQLSKKARLEVLLDDGYWPCFSTNKSSSTHAQWGYVGEGFIKEIDFSQVWFRLNEADEGSKEDIIGEWKDSAKTFLEKALVGFFLLIRVVC